MGIFDKVKEIASNSINTGKETGNEETIKSKISEGILLAVNKVSEEREHYYNKNNVPSIDSIINRIYTRNIVFIVIMFSFFRNFINC